MRSNALAVRRGGVGVGASTGDAIAGAVIAAEEPWSRKADDETGVRGADCGTTRYSTESVADALGGKTTQPALDAGSSET